MVGLITVDVGDSLGKFNAPRTADVLAKYSPLDASYIKGETRRILHTEPELTDEVIETMCNAILMDPRDWPDPWPGGGFTAFPYTLDVVAQLSEIAPVVAVSNVPITAEADTMPQVAEHCGQYLQEILTSYSLGMRKPDLRVWRNLCERYQVPPQDVVHIGDDWLADVLGAVSAGCRAVYIDTRECGTPHRSEWPCSSHRLLTGTDLRDALTLVRHWHTHDRRRTHDTDAPPGGAPGGDGNPRVAVDHP